MSASKISWTDDGLNVWTWNCNKVSEGCKHCYAQAHSEKYPQNSAGGDFIGMPQLRERAFEELRLIKGGRTVFVNTHSDTFHEKAPLGWIRRLFTHMNQRPDLIFLLLTKRPQIALKYASYLTWSDNIWLGTSIELQKYYASRLDALLKTPAAHRFISFEPLLGPIELSCEVRQIDWVIVGGESGEYRRPFGKQWALDIQHICELERVPFYFKQGSGLFPDSDRTLNGRTYDGLPAAFQALHDQYDVQAQQNRLF